MNELPKKITGEPPKKVPHPLDGRKGLSLVERVQVAVTKALNPEQGARLSKATGMDNDVKKLADDGLERSVIDTDKPAAGAEKLDGQKKRRPNPDEIAVGPLAYSKNYLKRQLGLILPAPIAETDADEESQIATLPKKEMNDKDPRTREKKGAVETMKRALAVEDSLEFPLTEVVPTVKLAAFLTGLTESAGDALPDFDAKPHLLPFFLVGLHKEGVFKTKGLEDLEPFVSKLANQLAPFLGFLNQPVQPKKKPQPLTASAVPKPFVYSGRNPAVPATPNPTPTPAR